MPTYGAAAVAATQKIRPAPVSVVTGEALSRWLFDAGTGVDTDGVQAASLVNAEVNADPLKSGGQSIRLAGSGYALVPHHAAYQVATGAIIVTYQPDSIPAAGTNRSIVSKDQPGLNGGLALEHYSSDGIESKCRGYIKNAAGTALWIDDDDGSSNAGQFNLPVGEAIRIAIVWGSEGAKLITLDDQDVSTVQAAQANTNGLQSNTKDLFFGRYAHSATGFVIGYLDDAKFWSGTFGETEMDLETVPVSAEDDPAGPYVYPAPTLVSYPGQSFIAKPALLEAALPYLTAKDLSTLGPSYDTDMIRISKTDGGTSNGFQWPNRANGEARCAQHYNPRQAWVGSWPDGRLGRYIFLARKQGSPNPGVPFLNGDTYEVEFWRTVPDGTEAIADPSGALRFIYMTNAGDLRYWYPDSNTSESITTFNAASYGGEVRLGMTPPDTGGAEWHIDYAGDYVAVCGDNGKNFVYRISTDTKMADFEIASQFDTLSIAPDASCLVGQQGGYQIRTWSLTGALIKGVTTPHGKHMDLVRDSDGVSWAVRCGTQNGGTSGGDGRLIAHQLPGLTNARFLTNLGTSPAQHVSARGFGARSDDRTFVWAWHSFSNNPLGRSITRTCLETGVVEQVAHNYSPAFEFADEQHICSLPYGSRCIVRYNGDLAPATNQSGGMAAVLELRDWVDASL